MNDVVEVSFVIRTFNSRKTLPQCIESVRAQTVPAEIVVVDSGSTDGTVDYGGRAADRLICIDRSEFTYGRALNVGLAASGGSIGAILSSHCRLPSSTYVERVVEHHQDPSVAATNGGAFDPYRRVIEDTFVQRDYVPRWGFSNHSSTVSMAVWRRFPFNETLPANEDKEWAKRILAAGYSIVYDRALRVSNSHRRQQGFAALYRRGVREGYAAAAIDTALYRSRWRAMFSEWRTPPPWRRRPSSWLFLVYPGRLVELAGRTHGVRLFHAGRQVV